MEPPIQYARTADGLSIAFWTLGEGKPLVVMPAIASSVQAEWRFPEMRRFNERLGARRMLIRYDRRGTGASDRDVTDVSLETQLLDLEAVIERLGLARFDLCALTFSVPAAVAYAVRHPQRVSHLILASSYARGSDYLQVPQVRAWRALLDADWEFFSESMAQFWAGWEAGETARQFAAAIRESTTPDIVQASLEALGKVDVTALLPEVSAPTLVFHPRQAPYPSLDAARALASRIPDARLVIREGTWLSFDNEAVLAAIDDFLGEDEPTAAAPSGLVTILFTDIEGSTALTQRLGDAGAQELLDTHNRIVREALAAHGGSEIKHTGDGIMASFPLASAAIECAIAVQRAVAAWNAEAGARGPGPGTRVRVRVRIGLNAGEPVAKEQDLFGTAVQLARRVCDHAQPGQVLVSDVVRGLAAGKGFLFADTGEVALKGFEEPVRLFEVRWEEAR